VTHTVPKKLGFTLVVSPFQSTMQAAPPASDNLMDLLDLGGKEELTHSTKTGLNFSSFV